MLLHHSNVRWDKTKLHKELDLVTTASLDSGSKQFQIAITSKEPQNWSRVVLIEERKVCDNSSQNKKKDPKSRNYRMTRKRSWWIHWKMFSGTLDVKLSGPVKKDNTLLSYKGNVFPPFHSIPWWITRVGVPQITMGLKTLLGVDYRHQPVILRTVSPTKSGATEQRSSALNYPSFKLGDRPAQFNVPKT